MSIARRILAYLNDVGSLHNITKGLMFTRLDLADRKTPVLVARVGTGSGSNTPASPLINAS